MPSSVSFTIFKKTNPLSSRERRFQVQRWSTESEIAGVHLCRKCLTQIPPLSCPAVQWPPFSAGPSSGFHVPAACSLLERKSERTPVIECHICNVCNALLDLPAGSAYCRLLLGLLPPGRRDQAEPSSLHVLQVLFIFARIRKEHNPLVVRASLFRGL